MGKPPMSCTDGYKGALYGLGISQVALAIGAAAFSHPVTARVYTATISQPLVNTTLTLAASETQLTLAFPLVMGSIMAAFFSQLTMSGDTNGCFTSARDYSSEAMEELVTWDVSFWVFFATVHTSILLATTSPIDTYAFLFSLLLIVISAFVGVIPRQRAHLAVYNSFSLLGYILGTLVAFTFVRGGTAHAYYFLGCMCLADYTLMVGHTADSISTMETVSVCRLSYTCWMSLLVGLIYILT